MLKTYFTADLHFGHANILKHQPNRPFAAEANTKAHDEWLLDLWRSTVDRHDDVYILGDLTFLKSEDARHLLEKLPGRKYLITGNHDGSVKAYSNYFVSVNQILDLSIKPTKCPFLRQPVLLTLCHYPLVTWNRKPYGSIMLHGHCHGKLDKFNLLSPDLRFDVGIDGELSREAGSRRDREFSLVEMEDIYIAAKEKAGSDDFAEYANSFYRKEVR